MSIISRWDVQLQYTQKTQVHDINLICRTSVALIHEKLNDNQNQYLWLTSNYGNSETLYGQKFLDSWPSDPYVLVENSIVSPSLLL